MMRQWVRSIWSSKRARMLFYWHMQRNKLFIPSALWPVVFMVLFAGVYAGIFFTQRAGYLEHYQYTVSRIPSVMLYGSGMVTTLQQYGMTYGGFVGLGVGLIFLVMSYLLFGIFALVRLTKQSFGAMLAFFIAILPIDALAYLVHFQPHERTAIASALENFVGTPLWITSVSITVVIVLLFILSFFYGKTPSAPEANA